MLGFTPCYHMVAVEAHRAGDWIKAISGEVDWDVVFDGYRATVDYPGCLYWRELAERYPEAKVLLSVRDPDAWFDSTQATIFSPQMRQMFSSSPVGVFLDKTVWAHYGDRIDDRAFMTGEFERHVAEVERSIPPERLLVYRVGEGWDRLCEFLGVPVPTSPFPRTNSREEMTAAREERGRALGGGPVDPEQMRAYAKERIEALRADHGVAVPEEKE